MFVVSAEGLFVICVMAEAVDLCMIVKKCGKPKKTYILFEHGSVIR